MAKIRSEFLRTLRERGFVHQCTDVVGLDAKAAAGRIVAYIGFDCTADSLHVGSLVQIMMLRWLQKTGHKPIVLMGGGTTKVGDPSGRDESRRLLSDEDIARNMAGIKSVFTKFLTFGDGPGDALMANNADWLDRLEYIPFLRDYGRHFSVNRMLSFDSIKLRLEREQPLTFLEFNYMVLQAYDYWQFWRNVEDGDVGRFLRLFTELDLAEIARLEALGGAEINEAKKVLATEATALAHGRRAAEDAAETARRTFEEGGIGDDLPVVEIARSELEAGVPAFDVFRRAGLAASNSEAKRLIRGGGARINDRVATSETASVTIGDLNTEGVIKLTAGRKRHALVRPV
jgi:tyrosyl-tRNA synthetase